MTPFAALSTPSNLFSLECSVRSSAHRPTASCREWAHTNPIRPSRSTKLSISYDPQVILDQGRINPVAAPLPLTHVRLKNVFAKGVPILALFEVVFQFDTPIVEIVN